MSREIKLRAWDKDSEVMVYSDNHNKNDYECSYFFQQDNNGNIKCYWEMDYDDSAGYPATSGGFLENIMQYTGLKDKNGKEIYEGDLITINQEDEEDIFRVEWDEDSAKFILSTQTFTCDFDSYNGADCEVIGNAYDNPLLQEVERE